MGGETKVGVVFVARQLGPSPRGRGNRPTFRRRGVRFRSIPAWAGKPRPAAGLIVAVRVHPRVGGETRSVGRRHQLAEGPSPRGRGNRISENRRGSDIGSIPAWAGKPADDEEEVE